MRCLLVNPLIDPSTLAGALAGLRETSAVALAEVLTCLAIRKVPHDRPGMPLSPATLPIAGDWSSWILADRDERLSTLTTAGAKEDVNMLMRGSASRFLAADSTEQLLERARMVWSRSPSARGPLWARGLVLWSLAERPSSAPSRARLGAAQRQLRIPLVRLSNDCAESSRVPTWLEALDQFDVSLSQHSLLQALISSH